MEQQDMGKLQQEQREQLEKMLQEQCAMERELQKLEQTELQQDNNDKRGQNSDHENVASEASRRSCNNNKNLLLHAIQRWQ